MRLFNKGLIVLGIIALATVHSIGAQSSMFLGAFGDYAFTDSPPAHSGEIGIHGNFDYRSLIGSAGYFNLTAFGEISIDPTDAVPSDYLAVDTHGLWYVGDNDVELTLGSESSFAGYDGYDAYWSPHWELAYHIQRGRTVDQSQHNLLGIRDLDPHFAWRAGGHHPGSQDRTGIFGGGRGWNRHLCRCRPDGSVRLPHLLGQWIVGILPQLERPRHIDLPLVRRHQQGGVFRFPVGPSHTDAFEHPASALLPHLVLGIPDLDIAMGPRVGHFRPRRCGDFRTRVLLCRPVVGCR